jgi:hypothetical protein
VLKAIKPHYETIGEEAREASVNYINETSHGKNGKLEWLWVMANATVAFFMIHPKRPSTGLIRWVFYRKPNIFAGHFRTVNSRSCNHRGPKISEGF